MSRHLASRPDAGEDSHSSESSVWAVPRWCGGGYSLSGRPGQTGTARELCLCRRPFGESRVPSPASWAVGSAVVECARVAFRGRPTSANRFSLVRSGPVRLYRPRPPDGTTAPGYKPTLQATETHRRRPARLRSDRATPGTRDRAGVQVTPDLELGQDRGTGETGPGAGTGRGYR